MDFSFHGLQDLYENKGWGNSGCEVNEVDFVSEPFINGQQNRILPTQRHCLVFFVLPLTWHVVSHDTRVTRVIHVTHVAHVTRDRFNTCAKLSTCWSFTLNFIKDHIDYPVLF